ncbi:hypothetical protein GCM10009547_13510 [Sporichthya brevicatena]|uniref:Uncharacterized protein n=1 Tax=Sporichthya brevicatena TaxID=171442 RepID=A0ABN1GJL4_9ACTN
MSDTLVVDKADEAIAFAGSAVGDLDGLLGGLPDVLGDVVELVEDVVETVVDGVLVNVVGGVLGGGGRLLGGDLLGGDLLDLGSLDGTLSNVLGDLPGTVGGVLNGLGDHLDHTLDVTLDQVTGVTAALGPVLSPVLDPVSDVVEGITSTLGVTDELPARLSALAGIAIVGGDSLLSNLTGLLDSALGLGVGGTVDSTLVTATSAVDEISASLGLDGVTGDLTDVVTVGATEGPTALAATADTSGDATNDLVNGLLADVADTSNLPIGGDLLVGLQGLIHNVGETVDSTVAVVLSDTLVAPAVPAYVDHTTDTVDSVLADPSSLDLGAELDYTLGTVDQLVADTSTALGLHLDLGGLLG